jgi:8-oxo-dGTP pyrophosphatase MutT (NUDIX family)
LRRAAYRCAWLGAQLWWRIARPVTMGVRVVIVDGDNVLLVRHTYRRGWFLPGGGLKRGESLLEAAMREAREEAGATLVDAELVGIFANFSEGKSDHVALFGSRGCTVTLEHDEEIAEVRWFPIEQLPADVSPGTAERIVEFLSGQRGIMAAWGRRPRRR